MIFRIYFSFQGERAFGLLADKLRRRVTEELEHLSENPFRHRQVTKLRGSENRYRLRIGRWRVLFLVRNQVIEVVDIFLKKGRGDYRRRLG